MDKKFMKEAEKAIALSSCTRDERGIGAVAVLDGKVILRAGNGVAGGNLRPCSERGGCIRRQMGIKKGTRLEIAWCVHAEQRLICEAAKAGIALDGAEVYVTQRPCSVCLRLMIAAGIKAAYYRDEYPDEFSEVIAKEAGFPLIPVAR